jgi:hypothetical protein
MSLLEILTDYEFKSGNSILTQLRINLLQNFLKARKIFFSIRITSLYLNK